MEEGLSGLLNVRRRFGIVAFPGLKFQTWSTHVRADRGCTPSTDWGTQSLNGEAGLEAARGGDAPGHGGGVVCEAEAAIGAEEDDAAVSAEAVVEIRDGFARGDFRGRAGGDAIGGPFAEDEFHDGFAPAGEGDGSGEIVGIAAATDERRIADAAWCFVEGSAGGGGGGEVAAGIEGDGTNGVMAIRIGRGGIFVRG